MPMPALRPGVMVACRLEVAWKMAGCWCQAGGKQWSGRKNSGKYKVTHLGLQDHHGDD